MSQIIAKISELRGKASGAIEDVPDNLIGTIIFLVLLTLLGLGFLMVVGYYVTR